ncbi:GNAT family N-acetyltransferase [Methylosinus sp. H3A]|uniref:GNAT family N-acetyltransferase n=1 Tax=Methylosinus sp. H3A TaxID=2785786 RepID=UPI0018C24D6D|nr:GNAT family N-acetyltransferase [Methylosinus sp. H3A]MBG0810736.1 GNAT family N-acetyltransferase [Methylosinus sp. H3A]
MEAPNLITERLRLRDWRDADLEPFAALNADPSVMMFFPRPLDRAQSDAFADRARAKLAERGFGLWAVEAPGVAPFLGFVGLAEPTFAAHFTPCMEIGWRLARRHWGHGYATEAAGAVLDHAFGVLGLPEIVSFTAHGNQRSRRVMERLGMHYESKDDFDHPNLPVGHALSRHALYRLEKRIWASFSDSASK